MDAADRFWRKVSKSGPDDCWLWTGSTSSTGYGQFRIDGKTKGAHRVAWFLSHGFWPAGLVCHSCDRKLCVNERHLWIGDATMNMRDAASKGRMQGQHKTLCKHGHPLVTPPKGRRWCPQCRRIRAEDTRRRLAAMTHE